MFFCIEGQFVLVICPRYPSRNISSEISSWGFSGGFGGPGNAPGSHIFSHIGCHTSSGSSWAVSKRSLTVSSYAFSVVIRKKFTRSALRAEQQSRTFSVVIRKNVHKICLTHRKAIADEIGVRLADKNGATFMATRSTSMRCSLYWLGPFSVLWIVTTRSYNLSMASLHEFVVEICDIFRRRNNCRQSSECNMWIKASSPALSLRL